MSASATRATSSIARRRFARFAVPALVTGLLTAACGGSPGGGTPAPLAEPIVTTLSGTGTYAFANGPGAAASFRNPYGVAVDSIGNVYVADQGDHRIRKITPDGTTTTLAGSGVAGFANGVGASAKFDSPNGITVDVAGNVYVADSGNYRIRKITPNGMVSTYAGISISRSDDGPISSASFVVPTDIAVDADGTMYVTDQNRVRKISTTGMVSTLAGSGTTGSANGTGAAASFDNVRGIDIDRAHNVYVTDSFNNKVRKISPTGVVSTFAGSGAFSTIDGPRRQRRSAFPSDSPSTASVTSSSQTPSARGCAGSLLTERCRRMRVAVRWALGTDQPAQRPSTTCSALPSMRRTQSSSATPKATGSARSPGPPTSNPSFRRDRSAAVPPAPVSLCSAPQSIPINGHSR